MSLWYSQSGTRYKDKGKFQRRARTGAGSSGQEEHRGWSYHFISHETGSSVRRITYSVSIADPHGNRVEYLRNFSTLDQAEVAARDWIDAMFAKLGERYSSPTLGNIPKLPNAAVNLDEANPEEVNQEK